MAQRPDRPGSPLSLDNAKYKGCVMKHLMFAILFLTANLAQARPITNDPTGPGYVRNPAAVAMFEKLTGHVGGWSGHVVDHIVPLCAYGPDTPANMQWQTVEAAKAKDATEKAMCAALKRAPKWPQ